MALNLLQSHILELGLHLPSYKQVYAGSTNMQYEMLFFGCLVLFFVFAFVFVYGSMS